MFSKHGITFWKASLERALKSAAQFSLLVLFGSGAIAAADPVINAFEVQWMLVLGAALGGFVSSILTSIASSHFGDNNGPSLTSAEELTPIDNGPLLGVVAPAVKKAPAKPRAKPRAAAKPTETK